MNDASRLGPEYFDELYARGDDPWALADRWYERRKRAMTMGILPRERFTSALEIGCSIGLLTEQLAPRCDRLVATDISARPLARARERLAASTLPASSTVDFRVMSAPDEWPGERFELIVLSEVGYYLDEASIEQLARRCGESLEPEGLLVACHWRHPVAEYPVAGDRVHEIIRTASGLIPAAAYIDEDVTLELLSRGAMTSVAAREGSAP